MAELFYNFIIYIKNTLGLNGICAICLAITGVIFIILLIVSLVKRKCVIKNCVIFAFWIFTAWQIIKIFDQTESFLSSGMLAIGGLCLIFLALPYSLKNKASKEQVELAKFFDRCASKSQNYSEDEQREEFPSKVDVIKTAVMPEEQQTQMSELDFSHVKNVLARLEYYSLTPNDKKQVKDLENALFEAETQCMSQPLKERINDGLGSLLKIMSKYGI